MAAIKKGFYFAAALATYVGIYSLFGANVLSPVSAKDDDDIHQQIELFSDVLSIVQRDYVETVSNQKLIEGAVKGMLTTLDPHSGYLSREFYSELQVETSGRFGGLGIEITVKDNMIVVVSPIEDSPAEKAGIQAGDAIVKIDGQFTKDLSLVEAVKKMRGPRGSEIKLSVYRKGVTDLIDVKLERDEIKVKSVRSRYLGDGYGYVRLSQFQEESSSDLIKHLEKLKSKAPNSDLSGLVLDLRNNPGGLLPQAVKIGDLFLNEGIIVYTDGRVDEQRKKYFAHRPGTEPNYPMIVLVNGGSASASEIVAGALKDHGRALILGTKTFGKGSVQTIMPLENGGALRLTTALYYTKSGRSLQAYGVDPDIIMEEPQPKVEETQNVGSKLETRIRESELPGAITNPSGIKENGAQKDGAAPNASLPIKVRKSIETAELAEIFESDPVLARALELLKTFSIFKGDKAAVLG